MNRSLLLSHQVAEEYGAALEEVFANAPRRLALLPYEPGRAYTPEEIASVEVAFYSRNIWEGAPGKHASPEARAFWAVADAAPQLQWLQILSVGLDHQAYQPSLQRGVRITAAAGTNAEPVALNALTGLLMLARGFLHTQRAQQQGRWLPFQPAQVPYDLAGKTALIIGTGDIGTRIARGLQALGVRTVGLRRQARPAAGFDEVHGLDALDLLLPHTDWLLLACPLTEQTRGLMDARRLALLPPGAGLVNVARGEIVVEAALIEALQQGRLLGAYLDVFAQEPLPVESPLWTLPQVIVTPHSASASRGTHGRGVALFLRNLRAYLQGAPMTAEVSRT